MNVACNKKNQASCTRIFIDTFVTYFVKSCSSKEITRAIAEEFICVYSIGYIWYRKY